MVSICNKIPAIFLYAIIWHTSHGTIVNGMKENKNKNVWIFFNCGCIKKGCNMFVIEKYDYKEVLQKYFKDHDWLFKVLVYGNILDFYFLKRLKDVNCTINHKVKDQKKFLVKHGLKRKDGKKRIDASKIYKKKFLDTNKK
jgi:hypothetical protein